MADIKITALGENITPISTDILPMVDDPAGTPLTQKVTIANLTNHTILDASKHTDSVVQTVSRGSLVYGNSTPKWDELVVGAANSVLWTDGTDISWSAAPRLANIADTGGTNRIKIATSSPYVEIDDNLRIENIGIQSAPTATVLIYHNATFSTGDAWAGLDISPTITQTAGQTVQAIKGIAVVKRTTAGLTTGNIYGLQFEVGVQITNTTTTFSEQYGASVAASVYGIGATGNVTVTTLGALQASLSGSEISSGTVNITTAYGLYVKSPAFGTSAVTTYYGIAVGNAATAAITNNYLLEVGGTLGTTPYFRIKGNFTAAANQTPLYISEGVTPTLRQLKTRIWDATAGHGFTNGDLVCYLV